MQNKGQKQERPSPSLLQPVQLLIMQLALLTILFCFTVGQMKTMFLVFTAVYFLVAFYLLQTEQPLLSKPRKIVTNLYTPLNGSLKQIIFKSIKLIAYSAVLYFCMAYFASKNFINFSDNIEISNQIIQKQIILVGQKKIQQPKGFINTQVYKEIQHHLQMQKDPINPLMLVITGRKGIGKTTSAIKMMSKLQKDSKNLCYYLSLVSDKKSLKKKRPFQNLFIKHLKNIYPTLAITFHQNIFKFQKSGSKWLQERIIQNLQAVLTQQYEVYFFLDEVNRIVQQAYFQPFLKVLRDLNYAHTNFNVILLSSRIYIVDVFQQLGRDEFTNHQFNQITILQNTRSQLEEFLIRKQKSLKKQQKQIIFNNAYTIGQIKAILSKKISNKNKPFATTIQNLKSIILNQYSYFLIKESSNAICKVFNKQKLNKQQINQIQKIATKRRIFILPDKFTTKIIQNALTQNKHHFCEPKVKRQEVLLELGNKKEVQTENQDNKKVEEKKGSSNSQKTKSDGKKKKQKQQTQL